MVLSEPAVGVRTQARRPQELYHFSPSTETFGKQTQALESGSCQPLLEA